MASQLVCLQCGTQPARADARNCRRCGLPLGQAPSATATLPTCPICYQTVADDGRLPSIERHGRRLDLVSHMAEHDRHPVGDDAFLESLRRGDRIRIGRWDAPFATVRRYLVTGAVEAGRGRTLQHNTLVTAMTQLRRWGPEASILGDQAEWQEARRAVADLMDRYHAGRAASI